MHVITLFLCVSQKLALGFPHDCNQIRMLSLEAAFA